MRQKKLKFVSKDMLYESGVLNIDSPISFGDNVHIEVGSGKGKFIASLAKDNPDITYVAIEVNMSVCYRILEKKQENNLTNLHVVLGDAETLLDYFEPNSVSKIYLNFSDPWPKARHHKRRLTHGRFLKKYLKILKTDGKLQFRTDHESLFNDSIEYIGEFFKITSVNRDVPVSNYMTEYEEKKRLIGPIYQLNAEVK